jgi:hypothetical protein
MARRLLMQALGAAPLSLCTVYGSTAQGTKADQQAGAEASPIYGITIPAGYRDWQLISVGHLTGRSPDKSGGKLMQLRAQLGNDIAIKAL